MHDRKVALNAHPSFMPPLGEMKKEKAQSSRNINKSSVFVTNHHIYSINKIEL